MPKIRVLIADDHALFRDGLKALFNTSEDITVIGEAQNGLEAIEKIQELSPDVVLLDIAMPELGGLEATLRIKKDMSKTKVLVLTQYNNKEYILRFLKAGASGYVLKTATGKDLVSAVRLVSEGGLFLNTPHATELFAEAMRTEKQPEEGSYEVLTDREKEVLRLVAEGHTSKEIADLLGISTKTVITHRTNLSEKLGLHNRAELIKYAINKGLIMLSTGP